MLHVAVEIQRTAVHAACGAAKHEGRVRQGVVHAQLQEAGSAQAACRTGIIVADRRLAGVTINLTQEYDARASHAAWGRGDVQVAIARQSSIDLEDISLHGADVQSLAGASKLDGVGDRGGGGRAAVSVVADERGIVASEDCAAPADRCGGIQAGAADKVEPRPAGQHEIALVISGVDLDRVGGGAGRGDGARADAQGRGDGIASQSRPTPVAKDSVPPSVFSRGLASARAYSVLTVRLTPAGTSSIPPPVSTSTAVPAIDCAREGAVQASVLLPLMVT